MRFYEVAGFDKAISDSLMGEQKQLSYEEEEEDPLIILGSIAATQIYGRSREWCEN